MADVVAVAKARIPADMASRAGGEVIKVVVEHDGFVYALIVDAVADVMEGFV